MNTIDKSANPGIDLAPVSAPDVAARVDGLANASILNVGIDNVLAPEAQLALNYFEILKTRTFVRVFSCRNQKFQ